MGLEEYFDAIEDLNVLIDIDEGMIPPPALHQAATRPSHCVRRGLPARPF